MPWNFWPLVLLAWLMGGGWRSPLAAEAEPPPQWLTAEQLLPRLELPVSIQWAHLPLRGALASLSRAQRLAIVLDRRVDGEQEVSLTIDARPLAAALQEIAADRRLGLSLIGPVAYFGPPADAARLKTLCALRREEAARLAAPLRRALLQSRPGRWPALATPREVLSSLAREAGLVMDDGGAIPHDLLGAGDLPALAWTDRLSLLAVQFERTFVLDEAGRTVRLVPLPERPLLERAYPAGGRGPQLAEQWSARWPDAEIAALDERVQVRATAEVHDQVARALRGSSRRPNPRTAPPQERYTLSVQNIRLEALLDQLRTRLKVEVEVDREELAQAGLSLDEVVSIQVREATLDELFQAALAPSGLKHQVQGKTVRIFPARDQP